MADPWADIRRRLEAGRAETLALVADLGETELRAQPDPGFSPLGWHVGHIAFTEGRWLLRDCPDAPRPDADASRLWDANGLPLADRGAALPAPDALFAYADDIRARALDRLESRPPDGAARLWRWIDQHEAMHVETMSFLRGLLDGGVAPADGAAAVAPAEMVDIPAGPFRMGSDHPDAMDNEGAPHWVELPAYRIDRFPVTQGQFAAFVAAGGYDRSDYWSAEGWEWRRGRGQGQALSTPLYWRPGGDGHPVCGVSWFEADAYARFAGKRLPAEAEWDKAACWDDEAGRARTYSWGETPPTGTRANFGGTRAGTGPVGAWPGGDSAYGVADCLGNVWEWTASDFAAYPGFSAYPYDAYSRPYFDGRHKVLRGGSWATRGRLLRASFRNWYRPGTRQVLAGFRCAADAPARPCGAT